MRVVIAGGHGKIALVLERLLADRGDSPVGLVRNPAHAEDLLAIGAEPVVCDLERAEVDEVAAHIKDADAVVFAAGAGPGSGADRKDTVDRAAAVLLADAAERAGVRRYLLVSSMGADRAPSPGTDDIWAAYIRAKAAAEDEVRSRDLEWTVLRPGGLTDDPATGLVRLAPPSIGGGRVTRTDVAAVLLALVDEPRTSGLTLELLNGDDPVTAAVAALVP